MKIGSKVLNEDRTSEYFGQIGEVIWCDTVRPFIHLVLFSNHKSQCLSEKSLRVISWWRRIIDWRLWWI